MDDALAIAAVAEGHGGLLGIAVDAGVPGLDRYDELVIEALVDKALHGFLHVGKVQHHPLLIERAMQGDIDDPALPEQAALCMQVGEVHDCQSPDEQDGHSSLSLCRRERRLTS